MNKEDNFATYQEYNFLNNIKEELEKEVNILQQQIQVYKDKEDKLREHCNHYLNDLLIIEVDKIPLQIVLQILNEGSDE